MILLSIAIFALCMMIKGGQLGRWFGINKITDVLEGAYVSALILLVFHGVLVDWQSGLIFALAWVLAVRPSIGEEVGAIGRYGEAWGQYLDWMPETKELTIFGRSFAYTEGQSYGIKKGLQRGVFAGSLLTLATGYTPFIIAGAAFVPCYWLGATIHHSIYKKPEDAIEGSELLWGAVIGLAAGFYYLSV